MVWFGMVRWDGLEYAKVRGVMRFGAVGSGGVWRCQVWLGQRRGWV